MAPRLLLIPLLAMACGASAQVVDQPCATIPKRPDQVGGKDANDRYGRWIMELFRSDYGFMCKYAEDNARLPPATGQRIVFMGDSITEGWQGASPSFFRGDRIDRGISGQTTRQMLVRFRSDVIDLKPAVVHILAGTNDIAGNTGPTSLDEIEGNLRSMAELAQAHGIKVVFGTVLPVRKYGWRPEVDPPRTIAALNDWILSYARERGFGIADYHAAMNDGSGGLSKVYAEDGVHPTRAGYAKMERVAEPALAQALKKVRPKRH